MMGALSHYFASRHKGVPSILIDADVILEFFINRGGFVEDVETLMPLIKSGKIRAHIIDQGIDKIRYWLNKPDTQLGNEAASMVEFILKGCIIPVTENHIAQARLLPLKDFESAVEVVCAKETNCSGIITQNPQAFEGANLPVWDLKKYLKHYQYQEGFSSDFIYSNQYQDVNPSLRSTPVAPLPRSEKLQATVVKTIAPNQTGQVRFQNSWWSARLPPSSQSIVIQPGELVDVIGRQNITLLVVPQDHPADRKRSR